MKQFIAGLLCILFFKNSYSHAYGINRSLSPSQSLERMKLDCAEYVHTGEMRTRFSDLEQSWSEKAPRDSTDVIRIFTEERRYSRFLNQFNLMHTSESMQKKAVSREYPRILLFQDDTLLGMTAHADAVHRTSSQVAESFVYNLEKDQWETRIIDFRHAPPRVNYSSKACIRCHGDPVTPIWRTYRLWPGSYNFEGDYFRLWRGKEFAPIPYTWLGQNARESAAHLNEFLNALNFRRIARELKSSANFKDYRRAMIAALLQCDDLPSYLGEKDSPLRVRHELITQHSLHELEADVQNVIERQYVEMHDYAVAIGDQEAMRERQRNDLGDVKRMAGLRYLFEARGVDVKRFSLNRAPGRDTYGYGFNQVGHDSAGIRPLLCAFIPEQVEREPAWREFAYWDPSIIASSEGDMQLCKKLKEIP